MDTLKDMDTLKESDAVAPPSLEFIVADEVAHWLAHCYSFHQWFRNNFAAQSPSADQQKAADQIQPWMIRITRALLSQMLDPQFPHRHLASSIEAVLWQLEEDWRFRHNQMTEKEADAILKRAFPDDAS